MIDVIKDSFILPLFSIYQFYHTSSALTVESVKEFMFHLFPVVNGFGVQVHIPIEIDPFKRSKKKMLHQPNSLYASIATRLNEVSGMLFGITLIIKSIEFNRLEAIGHMKDINPFRISLCLQMLKP